MTSLVAAVVLSASLQGVLTGGNPDTPRINRDEDLRRRTEESMNHRAEATKKLQHERDKRHFQENALRLSGLARETCSRPASGVSAKMIADRAKQMDGIVGQIIQFLAVKPVLSSPSAPVTDAGA